MARPSKYETMAKMKQIVKMSFADVQVTGYRNPKVTSKTGREYRKYEVEIDSVLWVSTTSFNKQSFSRRYFKAIENVKVVKEEEPVKETPTKKRTVKKEKPVEVKEEPTKYEIELTSVMWRTKGKRTTEVERAINDMANIDSIPELKKYFNTECKKFHPDHGGNAEDFAEVRFWYEEELRNIESIQTALDEILNESVVEPVDELHDLKTTYNLKDLKNAYRTLARRYHPDNLETGDSDRFKLVKTIYDVRKLIIEVNLESFGYDDPDFAELVDMAEQVHKEWHNIQY